MFGAWAEARSSESPSPDIPAGVDGGACAPKAGREGGCQSELRTVLLLALLILLPFAAVLSGAQSLFTNRFGVLEAGAWSRDAEALKTGFSSFDHTSLQYVEFPSTVIAHRALAEGHLPLWNPYTGLGRPLMGEMLASLLNPLKWPLLVWPEKWAFDFYMVLRLALAGAFAFYLARRIGLSPEGALLAGLLYGTNGYFMMYITQWHLSCDVWLPLLLAFSLDALQGRMKRSLLGGMACWACIILAGNPQPVLMYWPLVIAFPVAALRGQLSSLPRALWKSSLFTGISLALGTLLSLPFLVEVIPSFGYAHHLHQDHSATTEYCQSFVDLTWRIFVLPFLSAPHHLMPFAPISLLLAALCLLPGARRRPLVWVLLGYIVLREAKLLPGIRWLTPFHWMSYLPVYNQCVWYKYSGGVYLAIALLAGIGWEHLRANPELGARWIERWGGRKKAAVLLGLIAVGAVALGCSLHWMPLEPLTNGLLERRWLLPATYEVVIKNATLHAWVAPALLLFGSAFILFQPRQAHTRLAVLLVLTLVAQIASAARRHEKNLPWPGDPAFLKPLQQASPPTRFFALGNTMIPHVGGCFGQQDVRMFGPTEPDDAYELLEELFLQGGKVKPGVPWVWISSDDPGLIGNAGMDLLDVRYFIREPHKPSVPDGARKEWRVVHEGEAQVWQNRDLPGRVFWTPSATYVASAEEAIAQTSQSVATFRKRAILEGQAPKGWFFEEKATAREGSARLTRYRDNRVRVTTQASAPGVVVLADGFYPRWMARLDGEPVKIYRAYGALRAIHVPAGEHRIEFSYNDRPFIAASIMSSLVLIVMLMIGMRRAPLSSLRAGFRKVFKSRRCERTSNVC